MDIGSSRCRRTLLRREKRTITNPRHTKPHCWRKDKDHLFRWRLLLGHRTLLQTDPRRSEHRSRLRQRQGRQSPDLRASLDRQDRLCRDRTRRLRTHTDHPPQAHRALLPNHRPHKPQPAGQRPRLTIPHRHLLRRRLRRRSHPPSHHPPRHPPRPTRSRGRGAAPKLLSRRGLSSRLLRQEPRRILPHPRRPLPDGP